jgi:hypothetical protein
VINSGLCGFQIRKMKKMPPCHLLRPIFEASDSAGSIPDSAGLGRMQDPVTEMIHP